MHPVLDSFCVASICLCRIWTRIELRWRRPIVRVSMMISGAANTNPSDNGNGAWASGQNHVVYDIHRPRRRQTEKAFYVGLSHVMARSSAVSATPTRCPMGFHSRLITWTFMDHDSCAHAQRPVTRLLIIHAGLQPERDHRFGLLRFVASWCQQQWYHSL